MTGKTLPYSDLFLEEMSRGNAEVAGAFGGNIHLGYWDDLDRPDLSFEGFKKASERFNLEMFRQVDLSKPSRILDVGCGYGGTISDLNRRGENLQLVGLNIDPRQVARASAEVAPLAKGSNTIEFVVGDACELQCPSNSFDYVFAIDCISHFASRQRFFSEAHRVLKPQGKLICTEIFLHDGFVSMLGLVALYCRRGLALRRVNGKAVMPYTKSRGIAIVKRCGFSVLNERDINQNMLPGYEFLRVLAKGNKELEAIERGYRFVEIARKRNYLIGEILELQKI